MYSSSSKFKWENPTTVIINSPDAMFIDWLESRNFECLNNKNYCLVHLGEYGENSQLLLSLKTKAISHIVRASSNMRDSTIAALSTDEFVSAYENDTVGELVMDKVVKLFIKGKLNLYNLADYNNAEKAIITSNTMPVESLPKNYGAGPTSRRFLEQMFPLVQEECKPISRMAYELALQFCGDTHWHSVKFDTYAKLKCFGFNKTEEVERWANEVNNLVVLHGNLVRLLISDAKTACNQRIALRLRDYKRKKKQERIDRAVDYAVATILSEKATPRQKLRAGCVLENLDNNNLLNASAYRDTPHYNDLIIAMVKGQRFFDRMAENKVAYESAVKTKKRTQLQKLKARKYADLQTYSALIRRLETELPKITGKQIKRVCFPNATEADLNLKVYSTSDDKETLASLYDNGYTTKQLEEISSLVKLFNGSRGAIKNCKVYDINDLAAINCAMLDEGKSYLNDFVAHEDGGSCHKYNGCGCNSPWLLIHNDVEILRIEFEDRSFLRAYIMPVNDGFITSDMYGFSANGKTLLNKSIVGLESLITFCGIPSTDVRIRTNVDAEMGGVYINDFNTLWTAKNLIDINGYNSTYHRIFVDIHDVHQVDDEYYSELEDETIVFDSMSYYEVDELIMHLNEVIKKVQNEEYVTEHYVTDLLDNICR